MTEKLTPFDAADDLTDEDSIAFFISDALEINDAHYIAHAAEVAERARLRLSKRTLDNE